MQFTDHDSLMNAMSQDLQDVVKLISKDVQDLIQMKVQEIVYDPYSSMIRMYRRRGMNEGFIGSWTYKLKSQGIRGYTSEIFSDPASMEYDQSSSPFVHGNDSEDRRDYLATAIQEGTDFDFYVNPPNGGGAFTPTSYLGDDVDNWWTRPRDYWNPTIEDLEGGTLDSIIEIAFATHGIDASQI
jgi:hypothetical protein